MSRLFVSQELLDQWSVEGKVELTGNTLKLVSENRAFDIQSGVRFVKLAAGEDRQSLLGKVKTEAQLATLGAEIYMNSVLVAEEAYDVQTGWLCQVSAEAAQVIGGPLPNQTLPSQLPTTNPKTVEERSALAQFLLENLS